MSGNPLLLVCVGLLLAGWALAAVLVVVVTRGHLARAEAEGRTSLRLARRLTRLIEESPSLPLLVRADGRIEGPSRLAGWLGLACLPDWLADLAEGEAGIPASQLATLTEAVARAQRTGEPFRLTVTPQASDRVLGLRGHCADPRVSPPDSVLVWFFDFSDSGQELRQLRAEAAHAREDFAGLVGLIEAAPLPMWFRDSTMHLRLVNSAYVRAVGAESADAVVQRGIELVEPVDGVAPTEVARRAQQGNMPVERTLSATIAGQRRSIRVSDLPLGERGVAGYAVDIEEMEELTRQFRRFRAAQRQILDTFSAAVAQFDERRNLTFVNQPFLRFFGISQAWVLDGPPFDRVIDRLRDAGRLPEVRDFPEWRRERQGWFLDQEAHEEAWHLHDGTHLRVVAQPMPDGGLLMIFEDRTEQLQLSATRDTLLRTRTATFDNLFESLAVFGPDSRLQLWNRRFAADWALDEDVLASHPRADAVLGGIAPLLKRHDDIAKVGKVIEAATLERRQLGDRLELADGRHLTLAGVPLPDGNGMLTALDVTDSQKAEAMLRERNAALLEADAVKTRFIANMSYEFRTPLTSISGFAEMLASGLAGDLSSQAQDYVAAILASVERLGEQIESVLDLSQSEAGTLPLAREPVKLTDLLTEVIQERAERARQNGVRLEFAGNRAVGSVTGDPRRLARAFGHLIDNALTATPEGGRIAIECSRIKGQGLRVVIADNGRGMEPAHLARAFEGLRLASDGETVERGTAVGLPLVRQLIEAHGGTIELTSEPGVGTTALITLP